MKKKFVKSWKRSSQPRKQRKYRNNAPLHIKKKFMSCHLSRDLRKKHNKRNILVRKGDSVKILRGQFKGKSGKIEKVDAVRERVFISGIEITKNEGGKSFYPIHPSNIMITSLMLEDKKRLKSLERK